jgi:hypothetical protein
MEKRKRREKKNWVTPGVFRGEPAIQNMVEQVSMTKQVARKESDADTLEKVKWLEEKVKNLEQQVTQWEERLGAYMKASRQEREHLQRIVLLLKKEWEMERDAHRHC